MDTESKAYYMYVRGRLNMHSLCWIERVELATFREFGFPGSM